MDQWERNRQRINKVGSSDNPPPEETPLGTLIEEPPTWECCCCDQCIPRPTRGYSTAVGSFCADCFLAFLKHLFNGTSPTSLNAIRQESYEFIQGRREDIETGVLSVPVPKPISHRDIIQAERERLQERLRHLIDELEDD